MEKLVVILTFCGRVGIIVLGVILIISGILRWLSSSGKEIREKRLNSLAWIAVIGLVIASFLYFAQKHGKEGNINISEFLSISSKLFIVLILGVILTCVLVLLFIMVIYLRDVFLIITCGGEGTATDKEGRVIETLKTPTVIIAMAFGCISLFLIFPLFIGMSEIDSSQIKPYGNAFADDGQIYGERGDNKDSSLYETEDLMKIWGIGVEKIAILFENDQPQNENQDQNSDPAKNQDPTNQSIQNKYDAFVTYALVFIIALGISIAVVKILRSIFTRSFEDKDEKDLIEEYAHPIGLLAIGVASLWSIKKGYGSGEEEIKIIGSLTTSFGAVLIITTLVILVLEVIRLLMDMKEPFLRQGGRYLFFVIAGESAILLMNVLHTSFSALSSAIGSERGEEFNEIHQMAIQKMEGLVIKQMNEKNTSQSHNNRKRIFAVFKRRKTKK